MLHKITTVHMFVYYLVQAVVQKVSNWLDNFFNMPVATFSSGHVNMTKVGCFCCMYLKMLSSSLKIGFVKNDVS